MRTFAGESALVGDRLGLALAPGLTPDGVVARPSFFTGFAAFPQVLARGLATLADVTTTRYFQYTPEALRDPVLTASGDRLRAECFSACNGVYARLDLLGAGFDGGDIAYGTTNVDINTAATWSKPPDKGICQSMPPNGPDWPTSPPGRARPVP